MSVTNSSISDPMELAKEVSDALQLKEGKINYLLELAEQCRKGIEWNTYENDLFRRVDDFLGHSSSTIIIKVENNQRKEALNSLQNILFELDQEIFKMETYLNSLEKLLGELTRPEKDVKTLKKVLKDKTGEISHLKYKQQLVKDFYSDSNYLLKG